MEEVSVSSFLQRLFRIAGTNNQSEIARQLDIPNTTLSNWVSRGVSKAGALKISQFYGVNLDYVLTGQGEMLAPTVEQLREQIKEIENKKMGELEPSKLLSNDNPVPVISWVAAGSWTDTIPVTLDDVIEYLPRPTGLSTKGFCLVVRGESMLPEFKPNEIIYVEPEIGFWDLKNGDLVVVQEANNNEATFKQLVIGETSEDIYLRPLNKNWHEQRMVPKSEWTLIGKVVGKWVKY